MMSSFKRSTRLITLLPFAALVFAACNSSTGPGVGPQAPSLNAAATYGILAGTAVSCGGPVGTVSADIGIFPGSAISGFPTCTLSGTQRIATALAGTAQGNLTTAYNALKGMACGTTISADLGGTTLAPGVYCSASSVGLTGVLTLDGKGHSDATFVIQSGSSLTVAGSINLIGSAQAKNVYWQVGSSATIATGSTMKGNILALTSVTLNNSATLLGRALARNGAVSLGSSNTITLP
jgi:predicted small secreted protein